MPLLLNGIVMWSGAIIDIPEGWALCDGTNGTPDLRNRFIIGAGDTYSNGDTGGFTDATLVSHNHNITSNTGGSHSHTMGISPLSTVFPKDVPNRGRDINQPGGVGGGNHSHILTYDTTGTSATNANLPPYYALAFIQQIS